MGSEMCIRDRSYYSRLVVAYGMVEGVLLGGAYLPYFDAVDVAAAMAFVDDYHSCCHYCCERLGFQYYDARCCCCTGHEDGTRTIETHDFVAGAGFAFAWPWSKRRLAYNG